MKEQAEAKAPKKPRFTLLKLLTNLVRHKAPAKQYYLELGVYFLRKGANYKIGQVISKKNHGAGRYRVVAVSGMTYDFGTNKINHTTQKMVVNPNEIEKGR